MIRWSTLWLLCGLAALSGAASAASASATVAVSATVLSKNQCKFSASTLALAFGPVNPISPNPTTASTSITVTCLGSSSIATFSVTPNSGQYSSAGATRMRNSTVLTQYLPYTLSLSPSSASIAKNGSQLVTISGTIAASDASNAYEGSYADQVVLTLAP